MEELLRLLVADIDRTLAAQDLRLLRASRALHQARAQLRDQKAASR